MIGAGRAQGIECVAALEDQHGEQKRGERSHESSDGFYGGCIHIAMLRPVARQRRLIEGSSGQQPLPVLSLAAWHSRSATGLPTLLWNSFIRDEWWG
jgi:hypothetical protein